MNVNEIILNTTKGSQTINLEEYDMVTIQYSKHQRNVNLYLTKNLLPLPPTPIEPTPIQTPTPTPTPKVVKDPNKPTPMAFLQKIPSAQLLIYYTSVMTGNGTFTEIARKTNIHANYFSKWFRIITKLVRNETVLKGNHPKLQMVADLHLQENK